MSRPVLAILAAALACSALTGVALAHSGAKGVVRERMELMKDVAEHMKQIGALVLGKTDFDASVAQAAADTVAGHAAKVTDLFPQGSTSGVSEALPEIWETWDDFTDLAGEMEAKAAELAAAAEVAQEPEAIRPQFAELGRTCSGCHERFRAAK